MVNATTNTQTVQDAVDKLVKVTDTVEPELALVEKYEKKYQTYRKLYPALKAVFPEI
jgi:xylulokinase